MARPTLDRAAKFKLLCRTLEMPRPYVRGFLELIWDSANECGNPVFRGSDELEATAEWTGEPGVLTAALIDTRFVDPVDSSTYELHDYWMHCPEYVKKRRDRELERALKRRTMADNGRQRPTTAENGHPPAPAPAPAPAPTPTHILPAAGRAADLHHPVHLGTVLEGLVVIPQSLLERFLALEPAEERVRKRAFWSARLRALQGLPGGTAYCEDLLDEVRNRNDPRLCASKGYTGPVDRPAAWLNQQTHAWLEARTPPN